MDAQVLDGSSVFALLHDGIPFEVLSNKSELGLRAVLEEHRNVLPARELRDLIPEVSIDE